MKFPTKRMRRLREKDFTRDMMRETSLSAADFIYPMFVKEDISGKEEIPSMPGISRHSIQSVVEECERAEKAGIRAVMLFGIPTKKDEKGSGAWIEDGIVQKAMRAIKDKGLGIALVGDVCLCEYTSHGHCGIVLDDGTIDNDGTLELLADTALSQVKAGADMIAPSDMMDGRVAAIRKLLDNEGYKNIPIMSYAAKYASGFYGPFRDAAGSAPAFGDRRSHQMDPANVLEALTEIQMDLEEGADIVMVKPALAYLDVIWRAKEKFQAPVAAYNVSGEFAMVEAASRLGWIDRKRIILEILTSIKRAGADIILCYHSIEAAGWLRDGS